MRARSHVSTLLKLTLVSACAAMVLLWPTWRVALREQGSYQEGARMTGGGNCTVAGVKVTHGFALHCDANDEPNNLEVNWQDATGSHRFHLDDLLTASCPPNSSGIEGQPVAGFNTHIGTGPGTFDGSPIATAVWSLTDRGEPGKGNDTLVISIMAGSETVLSIDCILEGGNHQAHPGK